MITVLTAMLVAAWLAIVLLALGYAGLLGQIRQLQQQTVQPGSQTLFPELASPSADTLTFALAVSGSCGTCETVFPAWLELGEQLNLAGHRAATVAVDSTAAWADRDAPGLIAARDLSSPLLISYQPALLILDTAGELISADPVGSAETLRHLCSGKLPSPAA